MSIRLRYAATLEFDEAKPETVRGELEVANARLGARRATEALFKAYPGRRWRSLVVVLENQGQVEAIGEPVEAIDDAVPA